VVGRPGTTDGRQLAPGGRARRHRRHTRALIRAAYIPRADPRARRGKCATPPRDRTRHRSSRGHR
jgi:hypothetical protein